MKMENALAFYNSVSEMSNAQINNLLSNIESVVEHTEKQKYIAELKATRRQALLFSSQLNRELHPGMKLKF